MSSPTRNRVTRSQTKQDSSTKHDKSPASSTQPPDDVNIPTLITHEMPYADVNKIKSNNLRTYQSWWTKQQGSKISAGSITNMQLSLVKKECHKVVDILKARYNVKQQKIADAAVITQETDHDDLHEMSDQSLRHLFVKISKQCGETTFKYTLKVKTRNVLIATIIDRHQTIDKAISEVVASTKNISDDSSFESESESENESDDTSSSVVRVTPLHTDMTPRMRMKP